jgi:hypothetical protein
MHVRLTGSLAVLALVLSGTAQATPVNTCMNPEEIKGFVGYVLPDVVDGVVKKCSPTLRPDGYFNTSGSQLATRLAAGKESAWPMARAAFRKMGGEFKGNPKAGLSERTIRSLIDNEMVEKLTSGLPVKMCRDIEAIVAPLDPLPPENLVQLLAAIFNVAGRNGRDVRACAPQ